MNTPIRLLTVPLALGLTLLVAACGNRSESTGDTGSVTTDTTTDTSAPPADTAAPSAEAPVAGATATLQPTEGQQARGELLFAQESQGVHIRGTVSGLRPGAQHGFHIHEKGDCSAPDASSAGAHFNPTMQEHGDPSGGAHHAGDLFNLAVDATGTANVDVMAPTLSITPPAPGSGAHGILGLGVVVHAAPDDYASQPAGNSGARIACGVIE